jgi:transcriptional regulator GlxA family with amidase domain
MWMAENLHADLRVEKLAEKAGQSPRTFARLYVSQVGRTPAKAVEMMRLEAACRALEETSLPFKTIAAAVGLGNEQNLRRVMQRQFGIGPLDYRERFGRPG